MLMCVWLVFTNCSFENYGLPKTTTFFGVLDNDSRLKFPSDVRHYIVHRILMFTEF
jgi:hypothetical protein